MAKEEKGYLWVNREEAFKDVCEKCRRKVESGGIGKMLACRVVCEKCGPKEWEGKKVIYKGEKSE